MYLGSWNVMVRGIGLLQKIERSKGGPSASQKDLVSMGGSCCLLLFGEMFSFQRNLVFRWPLVRGLFDGGISGITL